MPIIVHYGPGKRGAVIEGSYEDPDAFCSHPDPAKMMRTNQIEET